MAGPGPHWPGWAGIRYLFIFGDSYSTVSWGPTLPLPTDENPLGNTWPGVTSVGAGNPNWVGYIVREFNASSILAFDYAISGNRIGDVASQINDRFLPLAGLKPDYAPWTADNSLFVTWDGINDILHGDDIDTTINELYSLQQSLYGVGARNFAVINVPPLDRTPGGFGNMQLKLQCLTYNSVLAQSAAAFGNTNQDASVFLWSAWDTFTSVLNDPTKFNITNPTTVGGGAWHDPIHPTSLIHQRIANDLSGYLLSLPAVSSVPATTSAIATSAAPSATAPLPSTTSSVPQANSASRQQPFILPDWISRHFTS